MSTETDVAGVEELEILNDIREAASHEEVTDVCEETVHIPAKNSPEWCDYILGQFDDSEVVSITKDGMEVARYPKVNGLRRLSQIHVGEVVESYPTLIRSDVMEHGIIATYFYHVIFETPNGKTKKYGDVGEILYIQDGIQNIDENFSRFANSVAVTRGEARTLRKALGISVVSWDELDNKAKSDLKKGNDEQETNVRYIKEEQKVMLTNLAKRIKVNHFKYLGIKDSNDFNKLTFTIAAKAIKELSEFQRDKNLFKKYLETHDILL